MERYYARGEDIEGHEDLGVDGVLADSITSEVEARRAVARMLQDGEWDTSEDYVVLHATILSGESPDEAVEAGYVRLVLDQDEPDCRRDQEHEWIAGGPRSHGGSVWYRDRCGRCGTVRVTDAWAQDPETGDEGLRAVYYERDDARDDADE